VRDNSVLRKLLGLCVSTVVVVGRELRDGGDGGRSNLVVWVRRWVGVRGRCGEETQPGDWRCLRADESQPVRRDDPRRRQGRTVSYETDLALEAGAMARALVTTMIEAVGGSEEPDVSTSEVQERLLQEDGGLFAVHLAFGLGMVVTSAVGIAASALVNEDDWQAAIAGQGLHPEFHDRAMDIWSAICANWVQSETAP
jgi:hypothetical protein